MFGQVDVTDIEIENHPNCNYDYLELFNGQYASSPSIGKFCTNGPGSFQSQSNAVRVVFFTDVSESARGFRLSYSFTSGGTSLNLINPNPTK